jgi:hypothetical protein
VDGDTSVAVVLHSLGILGKVGVWPGVLVLLWFLTRVPCVRGMGDLLLVVVADRWLASRGFDKAKREALAFDAARRVLGVAREKDKAAVGPSRVSATRRRGNRRPGKPAETPPPAADAHDPQCHPSTGDPRLLENPSAAGQRPRVSSGSSARAPARPGMRR